MRNTWSNPGKLLKENTHVVLIVIFGLAMLLPIPAMAHVSEQGLVLLLPTNVYITAGVLAIVVTLLLLAFVPASTTHRLLGRFQVARITALPTHVRTLTSLAALGCLLALIAFGVFGSRDPLKNPLPLYIWTFWWIGLVGIQGFIGNLWYWINPWTGLCTLLGISDEAAKAAPDKFPFRIRFADKLQVFGVWPAIGLFLLFIMFALADPAPDDPDRLAFIVFAYWLLTLIAMYLFGVEAWSRSGEFISIVMAIYSRMSPLQLFDKRLYIGLPGYRAYRDSENFAGISMAVFVLILLGCGSFDGINETFWWLTVIGVNPLEFPGRSAIIGDTVMGIVLANVLLIVVFVFCVWLGVRLAGASSATIHNQMTASSTTHQQTRATVTTRQAFIELSVSMLPIAFAYHLAHFLITFLVNGQYLIASSSDPLSNGSDLLGIGTFYVTTGFLNTHHSVEFLWLLQAGIVVLGHLLSVIMAHGIAVRLFESNRRAVLSQLPLAVFMILYTFLGLWLLASPKGG